MVIPKTGNWWWRNVRQRFCNHVVRISSISQYSTDPAPRVVGGVCEACGKILTAPYGLALKARLIR